MGYNEGTFDLVILHEVYEAGVWPIVLCENVLIFVIPYIWYSIPSNIYSSLNTHDEMMYANQVDNKLPSSQHNTYLKQLSSGMKELSSFLCMYLKL